MKHELPGRKLIQVGDEDLKMMMLAMTKTKSNILPLTVTCHSVYVLPQICRLV